MPRGRRIIFPGVPHHVTQRGNRREQVFFCDADRTAYLAWLHEYTRDHGVAVLAYCLMPNHVHLVAVPSDEDALHRVLRPLHTRYAQRVNRAFGWQGHVWQGRFFASALDEAHLWAAIRYVERNPVRARLVESAEDYPWSSASSHCGLWRDPLLSVETLRQHAARGLPCGSDTFIDGLEARSGRSLRSRPRGRPA